MQDYIMFGSNKKTLTEKQQLSYPGYLSDKLFGALHCERTRIPEIVSIQFQKLVNPMPLFIDQRFGIKHTTYNLDHTTEETPQHRIVYDQITQYLQPILFPFYAYQQMINQYDDSGMIAIEFRKNQKLVNIIPNYNYYKSGQKMNFCRHSVLTIAYLKNKKQCDCFLKCCGMKEEQRADLLETSQMISETYKNTKNTFFPVCLSNPADGYSSGFLKRKPDNFSNMEIEGKLFEKNLRESGSGLWTCHALNVYLYDKLVYALDIYAAIDGTTFCKPSIPKCASCNETKWNQKMAKKASTKLRKCKECKLAFYCSRKCQKYHWKYKHKRNCWKHRGNMHFVLGDKLENR